LTFVTVSLLAVVAMVAGAARGNETVYDEAYDALCGPCAERDAFPGSDTCRRCNCCCDPVFTAGVDWMYLERGGLGSTPVFTTPGGADRFNASQFDFDFAPGIAANLRYRLPSGAALEGRYLWVDNSHAAVGPFALSWGDLAWTTPRALVGDERDWVFYNSRFQSVEINLRRPLAGRFDVDLLAGVRYLRFEETFFNSYTEVSFGDTGVWTQATGNGLIGFQVGADALICQVRPRLRLDGTAKAGAYYNRAHSLANIFDSSGGFSETATDGHDRLAFVGEMGFLLSYKISSTWSARLGYHLIWLDGVALAADQIPNTTDWAQTVVPFATTINGANTAFFHGFSAGLELRF
jgi:hypothetical protein